MLRRPPIAALVAAEAISATGSQMTFFALPAGARNSPHAPGPAAADGGGLLVAGDARRRRALAAAGPALEELGTGPALAGVAALSSAAAVAGLVATGRARMSRSVTDLTQASA